MIKENDLCIQPNNDQIIWRYMDLKKFESILKYNSIFFCRADRFSDPYEGSIPKREADYRIIEGKKLAKYSGNEFNLKKELQSIKNLGEFHKKLKKQYTVNCWHINNSENDSMWQLYLKSNEGIAIKSTVKKLIDSFKNTSETIYCSRVRYLDYEKDIWYHQIDYPNKSYNLFIPIVHKRIEFQQENELRLIHDIKINSDLDVFWTQQKYNNGLNIKIDPSILIDSIYTSPTSDNYQNKKVDSLVRKYGYKFNIKKSTLSNHPYY